MIDDRENNQVQIESGLVRVKNSIAKQALSLEDIWLSQPSLWQGLSWDKSQLKLWLICQPNIILEDNGQDDESSPLFKVNTASTEIKPDIGEEIAKVLQGTGKPMPLAQLKNKLPAGVLATEPMLKSAISKHPHLALTGPLVRLVQ